MSEFKLMTAITVLAKEIQGLNRDLEYKGAECKETVRNKIREIDSLKAAIKVKDGIIYRIRGLENTAENEKARIKELTTANDAHKRCHKDLLKEIDSLNAELHGSKLKIRRMRAAWTRDTCDGRTCHESSDCHECRLEVFYENERKRSKKPAKPE